MDIKVIGVIGAGQMGNGIAQVAAMSGLDVIMNDIATEFVEKGLGTIKKNVDRSVEKGKMSKEDRDASVGRIKGICRFCGRGSNREGRFEVSNIQRPGHYLPPRSNHFNQYIFYPYRTYSRTDQKAGEYHRNALHESRAGHAIGGGDQRAGYFR